jgi:predicted DNA-binding helix-hairpin-helix protein
MGNNSEKTMDDLIFTVEILRLKYAFKGYVHLKILPGSSRYQVKRAVELANRVSLNIEEPNSSRLSEVCSVKDFNVDILKRQYWVRDLSLNLSSGQSTQLIIGATEETDEEIFRRIHHLYSEMKMRRIYYSAFKPIPNTRLRSKSATPSWREYRLYQIDWLYRIYKYKVKEIHDVLIDGFLQNVDPKIVLANLQLKKPIEVNDAPQDELLRIPGIGPRSARKIIQKRRNKEIIKSRKQLVEMGVVISRAQPYLKIDGSQQSTLKKWF